MQEIRRAQDLLNSHSVPTSSKRRKKGPNAWSLATTPKPKGSQSCAITEKPSSIDRLSICYNNPFKWGMKNTNYRNLPCCPINPAPFLCPATIRCEECQAKNASQYSCIRIETPLTRLLSRPSMSELSSWSQGTKRDSPEAHSIYWKHCARKSSKCQNDILLVMKYWKMLSLIAGDWRIASKIRNLKSKNPCLSSVATCNSSPIYTDVVKYTSTAFTCCTSSRRTNSSMRSATVKPLKAVIYRYDIVLV